MRQARLPGAATLLAVCVLPARLDAQAGRGEITGEVRDPAGARIAEARVSVREAATGRQHESRTTSSGLYTLPGLIPGTYAVTVEVRRLPPLRPRRRVRRRPGSGCGSTWRWPLGDLRETTTVTADAPLLQTESSSLGEVDRQPQRRAAPAERPELPAAGGPGARAWPCRPGSAFPRLNGGRPRVNEYLYDGISVLQPEPGTVPYFPVIDAIQEFKVVTNAPPAEFGRFNGGVINLSTKAGSNELHGAAFEFLRNEALNARNLFAPSTPGNPDKPDFRRNQFGFVLGGPIVKDRTFFFADYQGTRQSIGRVRISTVPTALQRQGVFTEAVAGRVPAIYDPATTRPARRAAAPRAIRSPATRSRPAASTPSPPSCSPAIRCPNLPGTANNYRRVGERGRRPGPVRRPRRPPRLGQRPALRPLQLLPRPHRSRSRRCPTAAATSPPARSAAPTRASQAAVLELRPLVRPARRQRPAPRLHAALRRPHRPAPGRHAVGGPGPARHPHERRLRATRCPTFTLDGFQQLGSSGQHELRLHDRRDPGRGHALAAARPPRLQGRPRLPAASGSTSSSRRRPPGPSASRARARDLPGTTGTGLSLASFLLGQVQNFAIDLQRSEFRERAKVLEFFVQDDWRATSRLTVNAGVRYTLNFPSTEKDDQSAVFNLATQKLEYAGRDGNPRAARELHWDNLGPAARPRLPARSRRRSCARATRSSGSSRPGITTPVHAARSSRSCRT